MICCPVGPGIRGDVAQRKGRGPITPRPKGVSCDFSPEGRGFESRHRLHGSLRSRMSQYMDS